MRIPFVFLVSFILVLSVISISFIPPDIKSVSAAAQWKTEVQVINTSQVTRETYTCFFDDCIVTTANGTLISFVGARYGACNDFYPSDIYMVKSFDGGLTWPNVTLFVGNITDSDVYGAGGGVDGGDEDISTKPGCAETIGNRTFVFFAGWPGMGSVATSYVCNYFSYSDDNGSTWSLFYNMTSELSLWTLDNYVFLGAGNSPGTHTTGGRLVIPGWYATTNIFVGYTDDIMSDPFSATWYKTGSLGSGLNEWGICQCENGSLYGTIRGHTTRYKSYSANNGSSWSTPSSSGLLDPIAKGSITEFTDTTSYNTSRMVLVWNNYTSRTHLTIAIGKDNCSDWSIYRDLDTNNEQSCYPDISITSNMSIAVIYMVTGGGTYVNCTICNLEWVSNGADSLDPIGGDPGGEYNPSVINEMGYTGNYSLGNESVMVGSFYVNWTWDINGTPSYHWINISNSSGFGTLYKNFNVSHAGVVEGSYCNYTITTVTASTTKRYIHIRSFYE